MKKVSFLKKNDRNIWIYQFFFYFTQDKKGIKKQPL